MAGNLAILEDVKLLTDLADIVYRQEAEAIQNIKFESEYKLSEYLQDCGSNYDSLVALLRDGGNLNRDFDKDPIRGPIAQDIFKYLIYCANSALQTVRNYTLRTKYLNNIWEHADSLIKEVKELDTGKASDVESLTQEALNSKKAMLEFLNNYQSSASTEFSNWVKDKGITFNELLQMHMEILGLGGLFENLADAKKILVYSEVIAASGRGKFTEILLMIKGAGGVAVVLLTAGLMVWDIFSSAHVLQVATRDAVVTAGAAAGSVLGNIVGKAIATGMFGVEAESMFAILAGFVTGIVGAFILAAFAGWLIESILNSGGTVPDTDGIEKPECYVTTEFPDGVALALEIAHDHSHPN